MDFDTNTVNLTNKNFNNKYKKILIIDIPYCPTFKYQNMISETSKWKNPKHHTPGS